MANFAGGVYDFLGGVSGFPLVGGLAFHRWGGVVFVQRDILADFCVVFGSQ